MEKSMNGRWLNSYFLAVTIIYIAWRCVIYLKP